MNSELQNIHLKRRSVKVHQLALPSVDGTLNTSPDVAILIWVKMDVQRLVKRRKNMQELIKQKAKNLRKDEAISL